MPLGPVEEEQPPVVLTSFNPPEGITVPLGIGMSDLIDKMFGFNPPEGITVPLGVRCRLE